MKKALLTLVAVGLVVNSAGCSSKDKQTEALLKQTLDKWSMGSDSIDILISMVNGVRLD